MWNKLGLLQPKVPQFIDEFIDWGKDEAGQEKTETSSDEGERN
jgi:hypothetical protein